MDESRLMEFLHCFVVDFGATGAAGNVLVGEQLGLYRAMREGPLLPAELAVFREAFVFIAVTLVLLFRPQGLLPARGLKERI